MASEFSNPAGYANRQQAALERALSELRTVLAEDDNWRALAALQSVGEAAGGVVGKAWLARQDELLSALGSNPVYGVYRELEDALLALTHPAEASEPAQSAEATLAAEDEEQKDTETELDPFFATDLGARIVALDSVLDEPLKAGAAVVDNDEAPSIEAANVIGDVEADSAESDSQSREHIDEVVVEEPAEPSQPSIQDDLVESAALSILAAIEAEKIEDQNVAPAEPTPVATDEETAEGAAEIAADETSEAIDNTQPPFELTAQTEISQGEDAAEVLVEAHESPVEDINSAQDQFVLEAPEAFDEPVVEATGTSTAPPASDESIDPAPAGAPDVSSEPLTAGLPAELSEEALTEEPIALAEPADFDYAERSVTNGAESAPSAPMYSDSFDAFADQEPAAANGAPPVPLSDEPTAEEDAWLERLRARRAKARRDTEAMRDALLQSDPSPAVQPPPVPAVAEPPRTFIRARPEMVEPKGGDEAEVKIVVRNSDTPVVASRRSLERAPRFQPRYPSSRSKAAPAPASFEDDFEEASVEIIKRDA